MDESLSLSIKGPLGKRKAPGMPGGEGFPGAKKRFDSDLSTSNGAFLNPNAMQHGSLEIQDPLRRPSVLKSFVGAFKNKEGIEPALKDRRNTSFQMVPDGSGAQGRVENATNRRLSMWGEQLHDKLFAKRDMKDVMRTKLKLNLKDEANNSPQIYHTDISNIIDYDEEDKENIVKSNFGSDFIESTVFRSFILITIIINSIFIALQTDKKLEQQYGYLFSAIDQLILTIFVCEILLKWYQGFFTYWKVPWNVFDFIIVAASLIGPRLAFVNNSRVLRILRVLRAFRSLRSISVLRPLQLVVQTIIQSLPDMANILLLLIIFMFVFAVIGVSFFKEDSPQYFGTIWTAMFSLFICITLDGWMEIFNTLRPVQFTLAAIYFIVFILIGAFILINLVVAVVVTNLESAIAEQDELDLQQLQEEKGSHEDRDDLHTYDLRNVLHKKFWKHQKPIEVPNLPALNPHKVQNYMILVTALEDNYSEMVFLKDELSKIAKEVWEWNSPVDDDPEPGPVATSPSKSKRTSVVQIPKLDENKGGKRTSTLARLLKKASLVHSGAAENTNSNTLPDRRMKRKSTISSLRAFNGPLKMVQEESEHHLKTRSSIHSEKAEGEVKEEDEETEDNEDAVINVDSDSDESEDAPDIQIADLYSNLKLGVELKSTSMTSTISSDKNNRMNAIRDRRASLLEEMEKRDTNRGDVLTDLIKMNKKTNHSGKSSNMSQFVHGVDWLKSKVKGQADSSDKKKKWQVETEKEQERRTNFTKPEYSAARGSLTSENLVKSHLSYIAASTKGTPLDVPSQENIARRVSDIRRSSIIDLKKEIEGLYSAPESEVSSGSVELPAVVKLPDTEPDSPDPEDPALHPATEETPFLEGQQEKEEGVAPSISSSRDETLPRVEGD